MNLASDRQFRALCSIPWFLRSTFVEPPVSRRVTDDPSGRGRLFSVRFFRRAP